MGFEQLAMRSEDIWEKWQAYIDQKLWEIRENIAVYSVKSWDTLWSIANKFWILDYRDLIELNEVFWNKISKLIHPWDKIIVPKDIEKFRKVLQELNKISTQISLNSLVAKWETDRLREQINEDIFPDLPITLWVAGWMNSFLDWERETYKPDFARISLVSMERIASCSHTIKQLFLQLFNPNDLPTKYIDFLNKQNIDAWNFPVEIKEIWSRQVYNLMDNFNWRFWAWQNPFDTKEVPYEDKANELVDYLKERWVPGSLIPIYFTYSWSRWKVDAANQWREEKHYNTHMAVYAGDSNKVFQASEVKYFRENPNWEAIDFTSFLISFLQDRSDFKFLASKGWIKRFEDGIKKYHDTIEVKVNWRVVDILAELSKWNQWQLKIWPNDKIEISWPMVIDWVHFQNGDNIDEVEKMNTRVRFLWELLMSQVMLPTEIIEHDQTWPFWYNQLQSKDRLKPIDNFSLKSGETMESALRKKLPETFKSLFDKLDKNDPDYNVKYEELFKYLYAKQVKWLQLAWYIQNENDLNPRSTYINRLIPIFDIENIETIYREFLNTRFERELEENDEFIDIKSYIDVQIYPWDHYWLLFSKISRLLEPYIESGEYPYLKTIKSLNEFLKRKFIIDFVSKAIKTWKDITPSDILSWNYKYWEKFIMTLRDLNELLKNISETNYSKQPIHQIKPVDAEVIDAVWSTLQSRNLLRKTISLESYVTENNSWWKPNWMRLKTKSIFERIPALEYFKDIQSYWDFQMRIETLRNWFNPEWPTKEQLIKAINKLKEPDVLEIIQKVIKSWFEYRWWHAFASWIMEDIKKAESILDILQKEVLTKDDYNEITDILLSLIKIDDSRNSQIIWKIISASLAEDKLNSHIKHIDWWLVSSWEDMIKLYEDPEKISMIEELSILVYNQWESKVLYWLNTNFMLRIIDWLNLEKKTWVKMTFPEIEVTESGSLIYWANTFAKHLRENILPYLRRASEELVVKEHKFDNKIINILINYCEDILKEYEKQKAEKWEDNVVLTNKIIAFFKYDKELTSLLENYQDKGRDEIWINNSILPETWELNQNPFWKSFFNHINKLDNDFEIGE